MKTGNLTINICSMSEADIVEVKKIETEYSLSPWTFRDYYDEIKRADSISLIARIDKQIVGFIISRLIMLENTSNYEIEIYNICVVDEHRRRNIGKSLIEKLAKTPNQNIKYIWVDVRKSNANTLHFYDKLNFRTTHTRKNFYRNPTEDGLVLKLEL